MLEGSGDVQVGGSGGHHVDLGELVVEDVGICDESVEDFEGGEKGLFAFGVGDAVGGLVESGDVDARKIVAGDVEGLV